MDIFKRQKALHQTYRRLFNSPDGQAVLRHLMQSHFILQNTVVEGDPCQTHFNEGQRAVVLRILNLIKFDAEHLINLSQGDEAR